MKEKIQIVIFTSTSLLSSYYYKADKKIIFALVCIKLLRQSFRFFYTEKVRILLVFLVTFEWGAHYLEDIVSKDNV